MNILTSLQSLRETALNAAGLITFSVENIQVRSTKTGNCEYRATTDNGKIVFFYDSTADACLDLLEDGKTYRLKPGVQVTTDGSLIPAGSGKSREDFWS